MTPIEMWQILGGKGDLPGLSGKYGGELVILGSGRCIWDDLESFRGGRYGQPHEVGDVMAVNDIGTDYRGHIKHWLTMWPQYMPGWMFYRTNHSWGARKPITHSHKQGEGIDYIWPTEWIGGSSGLLACYVGLLLGYSNILLAGMPLTMDGRYFDSPEYASESVDPIPAWRWARDNVFEGRVKSLSGRSKELLE